MLNKISFDSEIWQQTEKLQGAYEVGTGELVEAFMKNPDTNGDVFSELHDRIYDSCTCLPMFYLVLPYLIDTAINSETDIACNLWAWIGSFLSEGIFDNVAAPKEVMMVYDQWRKQGVKKCIEFIVRGKFGRNCDNIRLLAAPLAMVNSSFGYMSALYDVEIYASAICDCGEEQEYIINANSICNEEGLEGELCKTEILQQINEMPEIEDNLWKELADIIKCKGSGEYSRMAEMICRKGICEDTPSNIVLVLYGSLLECFADNEGEKEFAKCCFNMLKKVQCPKCHERFIFYKGVR